MFNHERYQAHLDHAASYEYAKVLIEEQGSKIGRDERRKSLVFIDKMMVDVPPLE